MIKVSDEDQKQMQEYTKELSEISNKMDSAFDDATHEIANLNEQIQRYNNVLKNVEDFRAGLHQKMTDFLEGNSRMNGDENEAYADWVEAWDTEFGPLDLIENIELEERNDIDTLENLPLSP